MKAMPDAVASVHPTGEHVCVAPGEALVPWPLPLPVSELCGVFEWLEIGGGNYQPKLRLHPRMIRMRANIGDELGLGVSYNALRRLMTAGFVRSLQITPGQYAFDLHSYRQHCDKVAADPEFWSGVNRRKYMEAIQ